MTSKLRPDAVDTLSGIIYELKPCNKGSFMKASDTAVPSSLQKEISQQHCRTHGDDPRASMNYIRLSCLYGPFDALFTSG